MWIFMNNAFISAVEHKDYKNVMSVRARVSGDLENVFGDEVEVFEDAGTDYKFRAFVTRTEFKRAVDAAMDNIDYTNFKSSIPKTDVERSRAYMDVWSDMYQYQETMHPSEYDNAYSAWWASRLGDSYKYQNENSYWRDEECEYYNEIERKWEKAISVGLDENI